MSKRDGYSHLCWVDLETTDLPLEHDGVIDFTNVHILEVAVIVTDRALNIHEVGGYTEVIGMTPDAYASLKANDVVRKMHIESGLIRASIDSKKTLEEVDEEVSAFLAEVGIQPRGFAIAGSGVAAFDHPLIRAKMPKTAAWLTYFSWDIGVERRVSKDLAGRDIVNPTLDSYGESKLHRALNDIEAHLREAQRYRDWYRAIPQD